MAVDIRFRASNGQYVCAEAGGGRELVANRNTPQAWETFRPVDVGGIPLASEDRIGLQAANGLYVTLLTFSIESGVPPVQQLYATSASMGDRETFIIQKIDASGQIRNGDRVALRTNDGRYVRAERGGGGGLFADSNAVGQSETFVAELVEVPDNTRVQIELMEVTCGNTEDLTGSDEFYVRGGVVTDTNPPSPVLTTPFSINNGQTRVFAPDQRIVFDGVVPRDQSIAMLLEAFEEDVAHDWSKRPEWLDDIGKSIGVAAGGAVVAGLSTNPVGWGVIGAAVSVGLATGLFWVALGADKDDFLGSLQALIPASGPSEQTKEWTFSQGGWWSSWNYTVRYRIRRQPTTVAPPMGSGGVIAADTVGASAAAAAAALTAATIAINASAAISQ